ncbi:MAG TPA: hypothetical protein VFH34_04315, partial [Anaerolineales bacterium]|nr:hypothetical protein [Anaerolineales bacterium]
MNEQRYLPNADRVGMLTSTVLLAFALSRLIQAPEFNVEIQLPGFFFLLPLNLTAAMSVLTAGLTATGMDWLLREHPSLRGRPTYQWWLLPTLTTFVIGVPLSILPTGAAWWMSFLIAGVFLFFVFVAEYIVVDPGAPYYAISMAGLTAISYTLFLVLSVALRYGTIRLYILAPGLFLAAALASL